MNNENIRQIPGLMYKHGSHNKLIDSNTATYVPFYTETNEIKQLKAKNDNNYKMGFA